MGYLKHPAAIVLRPRGLRENGGLVRQRPARK
jgi:hypothetical protein